MEDDYDYFYYWLENFLFVDSEYGREPFKSLLLRVNGFIFSSSGSY